MKEVKLSDWLPEYIREYKEIQVIMDTETKEIEELYKEIYRTFNNQFILNCDEEGISRFEELLKLTPNDDDNLPGRISRVLSRWNDTIPYTYKGLKQKLDLICGRDNYYINFNNDKYELEIIVSMTLSGQVEELNYMLSYMIPSNIVIKSSNKVTRNISNKKYTMATIVKSKEIIISGLDKEHEMCGCFSSPFIIDNCKERVIKG